MLEIRLVDSCISNRTDFHFRQQRITTNKKKYIHILNNNEFVFSDIMSITQELGALHIGLPWLFPHKLLTYTRDKR